jgi:hypothetical protein
MNISYPIQRHDKAVVFCPQPDIRKISLLESSRRLRRSRLKMEKQLFEKYDGRQVTEDMLEEVLQLFSENYGIWGEQAAQAVGKFAEAGKSPQTSLAFVY